MEGVEFYGMVDFLKGGVVAADALTTVSTTYAREILTPSSASASTACCAPARRTWSGSSTASTTRSTTR